MKVGVISDTHISGLSLSPKKLASRLINKVSQSALDLIETVRPHFDGADLIIHAGDFVSWEVMAALEEFAPVEGVAGNMDPYEITSRLPGKQVGDKALLVGAILELDVRTGAMPLAAGWAQEVYTVDAQGHGQSPALATCIL